MSEMKSLTINGKTYDGFVDPVARKLATTFAVINSAEGESITVSDSSDSNLHGLRIYGKTTQDGTPTLETPIDPVGASDVELSVNICGKNLFTGWIVGGINADSGIFHNISTYRRTDYIPISAPGQKYSISNTPDTLYNFTAFYDAEKKFISRTPATPTKNRRIEPPVNAKYFVVNIYENPQLGGKINEAEVMANSTQIEIGDAATEYERGKRIQTATVSTPNGLHGIPVSSGGNYTDDNGQQWICDEIDFARGVYIQRVLRAEVQASDFISVSDGKANARTFPQAPDYYKIGFCSHAQLKYTAIPEVGYCGVSPNGILVFGTDKTSLDDFRAWLGSDKIQVLVPTQSAPIETPLSEAELAAYAALYTYREQTTISNDGHAYMELEYVMDAKKYIDSLVGSGGAAPARIGEVTLLASAWKGTDNLHSQVVSIAGVTPYSKVDLLPSVEQLAIFHNKDVAFVTENEDGVVTVYAIGDKPTLNYTMQVSITEVEV